YARQLAAAYPETNANRTVGVIPAGGKTHPVITLMGYLPLIGGLVMGIVGLVLLIACANVANLLLARAAARRREIATRLALGASRWRLMRQLLTESLLLALAGGGSGLLLAQWLTGWIPAANPQSNFATFDFAYDLSLDRRVLGFTLLASVLTGILFGPIPAWQATRTDLVSTLKAGEAHINLHSRRFNARNVLVIAQMALSVMLLIGAGLFVKSMQRAKQMNPGFEAERVLLANVDVGLQGYDEAKGREFYKRIVERIKTLPGVEAASLGNWLPLAPDNNGTTAQPEGYVPQYKNERIEIGYSVVGHEYFQTMNTRLAQGRSFAVTDDQSSPRVVIINETMARRFWPQQNPIGKRLRLGNNNEAMYEVVGVAEDGKYYFLGEAPKEFMFLPLQQNYSGQMTLLARTSVAPETLAAAVRQEVAQLDSELPVHGVKTMTAYLGRLLAGPQFIAGLVSIFGLLA